MNPRKNGLIVTGYTGKDTDIIIPNRLGTYEVIGIEKTAFAGKSITSIKFSSKTVYLEESSFMGCSYLTTVDFNDCPIREIPENTFKNTQLKEIRNQPDTIEKIGGSAFYNTKLNTFIMPASCAYVGDRAFERTTLSALQLSDVQYIGAYAFIDSYLTVLIPDTATFIGNQAFKRSLVYLSQSEIPAEWGSAIAYIDNAHIALNCKANESFIYGQDGEEITVYQYIGQEKALIVPSTIDNYPVTKIGYGFDNKLVEEVDVPTLSFVQLPTSIRYIDKYAFNYSETFVSISESIECVSEESGRLAFFAFEKNVLPQIAPGWIADGSFATQTNSDYRGDGNRFTLNVSPASIEYDETMKYFYKKELLGYTLLAIMGELDSDLVIASEYNDLPVLTVGSDAIGEYCIIRERDGTPDINTNQLNTIRFESGIVKIQSYAIRCASVQNVFIPLSVSTINAYAFSSDVTYYCIEAPGKPDEWDTYWAGSNPNVIYAGGEIRTNYGFIYAVTTKNDVELLKYTLHSDLYIPRILDGMPVVKIKEGFYTETVMTVYIPSTVTTIEANAFKVTQSGSYFYLEPSEKPDGWASNWYTSSYSVNRQWNYSVPDVYYEDDFAYVVTGTNTVKVVAYTGNAGYIVIPHTLGEKTVTSLHEYCVCQTGGFTVSVPNTVTYINNRTFYLMATSGTIYVNYEGASVSYDTYYCINKNGNSCGTIQYNVYG